ncbi:MAG: hypothetical protein AAF360_02220 [Pseudomonadota bacterium]
MSILKTLLSKPPSLEDIVYVARAVLTRPGDIPGILRREAAKRRSGFREKPKPDIHGVHALEAMWTAAAEADMFTAPAGPDGELEIAMDGVDAPKAISALQFASSVVFRGVTEDDPVIGPLSLEAARLSLPQRANAPDAAIAARRRYVETVEIPEAARARLRALAETEIAAL